jgi:hypothetical protein
MPTDSLPGKGYAIRSNEAARIHHAARQRGGVDARGARPATENASSGLPFVRTARSHAASVLVSSVPCGLRELGWIRGSNVIIEYRFADSDPGRLAALANELVRLSRMRFLSQPAKLSQP